MARASSTATATYDLMLLLDVAAEDKVRAAVLKDVQGSISASGELVRHDRWGTRELAYPIDHKQQAEYHLLQFRPSSASLLESLDRSLRITDGVIRFRIVKLKPGTPEPPPPPPAGQMAQPSAAGRPGGPAPQDETPAAADAGEAPPAADAPADAAAPAASQETEAESRVPEGAASGAEASAADDSPADETDVASEPGSNGESESATAADASSDAAASADAE
jgi:small subunit ribosomal protein S6